MPTRSDRHSHSFRNIGQGFHKSYTRRSILIHQYSIESVDDKECCWNLDRCCSRKAAPYEDDELEHKIVKLHKFCLTHVNDSYKIHLNRLRGIKLLEEIIKRVYLINLRQDHIIRLVWSAISCIHHFHVRLNYFAGGFNWNRKRQLRKAFKVYDQLITFLMPLYFHIVVEWTITFYTEAQLWEIEYLCEELLRRLLLLADEAETVVSTVLDVVEKMCLSNIYEAKQIIRILYEVLDNFVWEDIQEKLLIRILNLYKHSILPENEEQCNLVPLQKAFEVCVRNLMQNLNNTDLRTCLKQLLLWIFDENVTDDALLDIGNVVEYAAVLYETGLYSDSLPGDLFPLVLRMISSTKELQSLLGHRVFQNLIDRQNNRFQFDTPRIFFQNTHFNIVIGKYHSEDKIFISDYREMLHASILASIVQHGMNRINLENAYTSISLMLVEVPCGYTAAAVVCLVMAIQETTLSNNALKMEAVHRLHATVLSIISLLCWVHKATVFYEYLNQVVQRRAQLAPHLNPPLKPVYQYAQHHILWNKPELFFEDWEARYGLWKCFRSKKNRSSLEYSK